MATITNYVNYTIFFNDPGLYQLAVAAANGNFIEIAPRSAAAMFGIPHPYPSGDVDTIPAGIYFSANFGPGSEIRFPGPTGVFLDDTIGSFLVAGQAGSPPSIFPAGPDGLFVWSGVIILQRGAGRDANPPVPTIAQRRWQIGYESTSLHEGAQFPQTCLSKDFSRVNDGLGFAVRGQIFGKTTVLTNVFRAITPATSWERHYFRFRRVSSTSGQGFILLHGDNSQSGLALIYETNGNVDVYNISSGGTFNFRGTVHTPTINQWYRYDYFIKFATGLGTTARFRLYVNGVLTFSFDDNTSQGINQSSIHVSTDIGRQFANGDQNCEIDIDDSINADLPNNVDADLLAFTNDERGIDWILGSHIRRPYAVTGSFTNWGGGTTNEAANLNQGINPLQGSAGTIASSTSGAVLEGQTDARSQQEQFALAELVLGAVAASIGLHSRNSGGTDGQLGYKLAGGAAVLTTINQLTVDNTTPVAYQPSGMILPAEIAPFSMVHTKSVDGNTDTVTDMVSAIEYLGVWGSEDDTTFAFPVSRLTNIHNSPFLNTQWGYGMAPPVGFCVAVSGTYIGNGLKNVVSLSFAPVHFVMIRRVGAGQGGFWCSTSLGLAPQFGRLVTPNIRARYDTLSGDFLLEINGTDTNINASGATYQFFAFCDPENRFSLNGAYCHATGSTSPQDNPLINTAFTPEACFVHRNELDSLAGGEGVYFKGPGIIANDFRGLSTGGLLGNGGSFSLAKLVTRTDLHQSVANMAYSLWRTSDGAPCSDVMVQLLTYTGDGLATKAIVLTPTSGRFPCFVMVVPDNGNIGRYRDPSHTGVNSASLSSFADDGGGGIISTGVDSITVGPSLNTNGVRYSVFAVCGGLTNVNGVFFPGPCFPDDGPRIPPKPPTGINVLGNGGFILNGQAPLLLLKDVSGIYTLVPGKTSDTLYDRQTGQTSVDRPILGSGKTGYIGG